MLGQASCLKAAFAYNRNVTSEVLQASTARAKGKLTVCPCVEAQSVRFGV